MVKPKDRRGPHQNAGLVYQYECECDQVYIGETGRSIKTREKEHKRAIRNQCCQIWRISANLEDFELYLRTNFAFGGFLILEENLEDLSPDYYIQFHGKI